MLKMPTWGQTSHKSLYFGGANNLKWVVRFLKFAIRGPLLLGAKEYVSLAITPDISHFSNRSYSQEKTSLLQ